MTEQRPTEFFILTTEQIDRGLGLAERYVCHLEAQQTLRQKEYDDELECRTRMRLRHEAEAAAEEAAAAEGRELAPPRRRFNKRDDRRIDRLIDLVQLLLVGRPERPELGQAAESDPPEVSLRSPRTDLGQAEAQPEVSLRAPRTDLPKPQRTDARGNPI